MNNRPSLNNRKHALVNQVRRYIRQHRKEYKDHQRLHHRFSLHECTPEERLLDMIMNTTDITVTLGEPTMRKLEVVRRYYQEHDDEEIKMVHVVNAMVEEGVNTTIIKEGL